MSALDLILATESDKETGKQARAELAQLRAQVAMLDDYAETIRMHEITIAEQARQLAAARELMSEFTGVSSSPLRSRIDAWLAANPAPESEQA